MEAPMSRPAARSFLPLMSLLLGCQQAPSSLSDADKTALRATDQQFAQLALAKNWATLAGLYTADATMMPPNAATLKSRSAIQAWMTAYPPITAFTLEPQEIDGVGSLAYVRGTYTITVTPPGAPSPVEDHGKYLEILRKQADGSWHITNDIFNSDVPLPPPTPAPAPSKRRP